MTVREARERVDSREFTDWMAFNRVSPFVPERGDMRAALVAWAIAVAHGASDAAPEDFLLKFADTDAPPSGGMPSVAEKIYARFGGGPRA